MQTPIHSRGRRGRSGGVPPASSRKRNIRLPAAAVATSRQQRSKTRGASLRYSFLLLFAVLLLNSPTFADQLLMTLSVPSATVQWQNEFILTLEIYGGSADHPPDLLIDGLDQFQLKGTGKNLLQVPRGATVKWILTYTLTATQDGTFKLGPAVATSNGRTYYSNTLFITVEAPPERRKTPLLGLPIVHSAAEVGDKVMILMEAQKKQLYRTEGITVTLRLLSRLPVENLRFKQEADFPGFLKYDFPFTAHPTAEWLEYQKVKYAAYELQKFLIFPLKEGPITIPPVTCELKVRVPSGAFTAADLVLDLDRSSNSVQMQVLRVPGSAIVGSYMMKNEILSDQPQSKTVRFVLEGEGELSTFDFPEISGPHFQAQKMSVSTNSSIQKENLKSRKVAEYEITPLDHTTSVVLPGVEIPQFDPSDHRLSILRLPVLPLRFALPGLPPVRPVPLPEYNDPVSQGAVMLLALASLFRLMVLLKPKSKRVRPRFGRLFRHKNSKLQISKVAAQKLYQQIAVQMVEAEGNAISLVETLKEHLPATEWLNAERAFRRLETTAFSQSRIAILTYGEMKDACEHMEKRWQP